jgi:hypothetical protein
VRLASYALELDATMPIMVSGYNEKFAKRLSRKIRRIVSGRVPLSSDRNAAEDWETEAGGGVRAVGTGVGIAGLPAGLIFVDDPTKNRKDAYSQAHRDAVWEWFVEDVLPRLEPDGAIVITAARRHEDDLIGRILTSEDKDDWTVIACRRSPRPTIRSAGPRERRSVRNDSPRRITKSSERRWARCRSRPCTNSGPLRRRA